MCCLARAALYQCCLTRLGVHVVMLFKCLGPLRTHLRTLCTVLGGDSPDSFVLKWKKVLMHYLREPLFLQTKTFVYEPTSYHGLASMLQEAHEIASAFKSHGVQIEEEQIKVSGATLNFGCCCSINLPPFFLARSSISRPHFEYRQRSGNLGIFSQTQTCLHVHSNRS